MEATPATLSTILQQAKAVVLDSLTSVESKLVYSRGMDRFLTWFESERPSTGFTRATVQASRSYLIASGLSSSSVNLYLTSIRRMASEALDLGLLSSEAAAAIGRVKGMKQQGVRTGNWLTVTQAEQFIKAPDCNTLKGKRDRALLAVLIGCGLRRKEAASLTVEHIQLREERWIILDLQGKGRKIRSIAMPLWTKVAIDVWTKAAGFNTGPLFRPVNKGDRLSGERMTPQSVFVAVKHYAEPLGFKISAHDCRRSYARLSYDGGSSLEQIQLSLAHSSVVTTEKYVGVRQDLRNGPADHLGLNL